MDSKERLKNEIKGLSNKVKSDLNDKVLTESNKAYLNQLLLDLKQAFVNLLKGLFTITVLNNKGWKLFLLEELIATGTGFTAGKIASDWVGEHFQFNNIKNGFGLFGKKSGRTTLDKDTYEILDGIMGYAVGLVMIVYANSQQPL